MASVAIVARTSKKSQSRVLLFVRIHHGQVTRYVSTNVAIARSHWNENARRIRKTLRHSNQLNEQLERWERTAEDVVVELRTRGLALSADRIKRKLLAHMADVQEEREEVADFFGFAEPLIAQYERRGQISTAKAYRTCLVHLRAYCTSDLDWREIDLAFVRGFQTYLVEKNLHANYVHKLLTEFRTLVYQGIKEGYLPSSHNPFAHVVLRKQRVLKKTLRYEEIQAVEQLNLSGFEEEVRSWWLFAFYAGGMRFSDVATLRWKHIDRHDPERWRVGYRMLKTKDIASFPLIPQARVILDRVATDPEEEGEEGLVFSLLLGRDLSSPKKLRSAIGSRNAQVNRALKDIGTAAGIQHPLTFHLARHSLAQYLRRQGFSIYEISKILAHASIRITEDYLRDFNSDELDDKLRSAF